VADPIDDFLSSGGQTPIAVSGTPPGGSGDPIDDFLSSGGQSTLTAAVSSRRYVSPVDEPRPDNAADVVARKVIGGTVAAIVGGYKGMWDLATGKGLDKAVQDIRGIQASNENPLGETASGKVASKAMESPYNPMNWPDVVGEKLATKAQDEGIPWNPWRVGNIPVGPAAATAFRIAPDALAMRVGQALSKEESPTWNREPEPASPPLVPAQDVPMPAELSTEPTAPRQYPAETPREPFEEQAPAVKPGEELPSPEQARRARVLSEVGLQNGYRKSAVTGDPLEAATDYQLSKLNTEPGHFAMNLLDNERQALRSYAEDTVSQTGGRTGDTQTDTVARGKSVTGALDALEGSYDSRIRSLYQAADERAKGVPTDLGGFQDVLKDDSLMTNQDRVGLRGGLNAYLKKLGVVDDNGNITASVQQAETIRKYLNDEWSPQNSKLVTKLKDALDEDVTKAAGSDIYQQARALRAEKGATLDNPKGINRIMAAEGPEGINRTVSSDKIMQNLETMDPAQLRHIMDTLRGMKGDLAEQGRQAIADIQSHFAQRAYGIGDGHEVQWNSKGFNQFLKNNSERLSVVFQDKPEVLRRLYTLNEAGKILRFNPGYPGAAAQAINIGKAGTVPNYLHRGITMGASALGGVLTGTPFGATAGGVVGDVIGGKAAKAAADRAAMKAATDRAVTSGGASSP
jgi:hypothetical protein